jgi:hypothetical protein
MKNRTYQIITAFTIGLIAFSYQVGAADLSGCVKEEINDLKKSGFTWDEIKLHCRPGNILKDSMGAAIPTGTYNSDFKKVSFSCYEGNTDCIGNYSGTNDKDSATIILNRSSSGKLLGYWHESKSKHRCDKQRRGTYYWGKVSFKFAVDANSWKGFYGYCDSNPSNKWNGWR